jgi:PTS system N-acetylglucosamine-specific IIC component
MGGILLSMALTSFLTGVTEPVEFAFMFLAPLLFLLHALLTGLSMAITDWLNIRLGFTFSGGFIDMVLGWGRSNNGWLVVPVGLAYAVIYYTVFDFCIRRFDLKTPGREDVPSADKPVIAQNERAGAYIAALGGADNLITVGACTTRLRLDMVDRSKASDAQLKALGAMAVVRPGNGGSLQVVVGPMADSIADEIRLGLPMTRSVDRPLSEPVQAEPATISAEQAGQWLDALGGQDNVLALECVAHTRLRVQLEDARRLSEADLRVLGCQGVSQMESGIWHVLVGNRANAMSEALRVMLNNRKTCVQSL